MIPPVVRRFIGGETADAVLDHVTTLNDDGIGAICNHLGEHYDDREPADADADAYVELLRSMPEDTRACVSVKPTQLGLQVDESAFRENLDRVVDAARANDRLVWLDMEDHTTVEPTLDAFVAHAENGDDVGVCLQANMRRTADDLERIADLCGPNDGSGGPGPKVRLVKGAYDPPSELAYTGDRVDEAYRAHVRYCFEHMDGGIAVASHDPAMIDHARDCHAETGTPFEVQMLMGVRPDAQRQLARELEVWQYVPYGSAWASYFYRRVTERWENLAFALRAVAGR